MLNLFVRGWPYVKDLGVALWPMRFGILAIVIIWIVWSESYTGQGSDVLAAYAHSNWYGPKGQEFFLVLLIFSLVMWLAMYVAVLLRFKWYAAVAPTSEPALMQQYRTQYPAPTYTPGSLQAQNEAARRVTWILWWRKNMPPVLGAAAPLITAFGLLAAIQGAWTTIPFWEALLLGIGLLIGFRMLMPTNLAASIGDSWSSISPGWIKWPPVVALIVLIVMAVVCAIDPVSWGLRLGPLTVFFGAVALLMLIGTLLSILSSESSLPIFSAALVALVIWHRFAPDERIRYLENDGVAFDLKERPQPVAAFEDWARKQEAAGAGPVPAVFVSTAGGGSRAAYWTASILGALEDRTNGEFSKHLIAISGVSGGSLGAAIYRSLLAAGMPPGIYRETGEDAAARDFLGPVLATLATHDIVPPLSGRDEARESEKETVFHGDRAVAIEQAWERAWADAVSNRPCGVAIEQCQNLFRGSFLKLFYAPSAKPEKYGWEMTLPALLLNGTAVETGARVVTSSLKLECNWFGKKEPCTSKMRDVSDVLAHLADNTPAQQGKLDVRVSTAVSNSARFPLVMPAATANIAQVAPSDASASAQSENAQSEKTTEQRITLPARIVDGGYFENFGATTLHELLQELDKNLANKRFMPIVIQISSDPELSTEFDPGLGRPMVGKTAIGHFLAQLRVPIQAFANTREAQGVQARLLLNDDVDRWNKGREKGNWKARYFHFRICPQPQPHPPLAWVLSDQAQKVLGQSLEANTQKCNNKQQLEALVRCLKKEKDATCQAD